MHDVLIIGRGLAGSFLARELLTQGFSVTTADPGATGSTSAMAAGLFNPITGKRWVRTWHDTTLLPYAEKFYSEFENQYGVNIRTPLPTFRLFQSPDEQILVEDKINEDPVFAGYVHALHAPGVLPRTIVAPHGAAEIRGGGFVDIPQVLSILHEELLSKGVHHAVAVPYSTLEVQPDRVRWKDQTFRWVFFCEGHRVSMNPWFKDIPFRHAKGEMLTIECPSLNREQIISSGLFILPVGNTTFKVGATYEWDDLEATPTAEGKEELITRLNTICTAPYDVVDHTAGVRPIARNRMPVVGLHPSFPRVGMLNGFGSKGVLYAPYYSRQLAEHLAHGTPLDDNVMVKAHLK